MKNLVAILLIMFTLIPLNARTRKPIPAGRFESLTGIKTSEASNVGEITNKELDSLWPKFNILVKPQSKIYLAPSFTNLVFPPNLNIELTREMVSGSSFDSAILSNLSAQDEPLIKMLKNDGIVFVKTEVSFKVLSATAFSLGLAVLHYSKDSGEIILKKE